ncbi:MAG: DUF1573 domain-containing protein [Bacillota bacterium]|nr:MAG: DUF1573 domain-containing protein [Bacillota bacterium]
MADLRCRDFQETVGRYLARHKSVLDLMSKLQEASARTNRAVAKAVTSCGCVQVVAAKQQVPDDASYSDIARHMQTHLEGDLCENCREALEGEVGRQLLYLAGLCEVAGLCLATVLEKEHDRLSALGPYYFC